MSLVWHGRFQTLAEWPDDGFTGIATVPDMGRDANGRRIRAKSFTYADGATITSVVFERVAEGISLSAIGNRVENNLFISNFPPISAWQNLERKR